MIEVVNEWSKPAPEDVNDYLLRQYGRNPFGAQNYRVIWAPENKEIVGGVWGHRDDNANDLISNVVEYRKIPKYDEQQWILEEWVSAEQYVGGGPELFQAQTYDALLGVWTCGPYPTEGVYERFWTFPYLPTIGMVEFAARLRWASKMSSRAEKTAALQRQRADKQRAEELRIENVLYDTKLAFGGDNFSGAHVQGDRNKFNGKIQKINVPAGQFFQGKTK